MKHLIIRTVFGLTLLLTLVAIFGGINPVPAHADALQRVDCSTGNPIRIRTDFGNNTDCFAGSGAISGITLYNADVIYTGDYSNVLICYQDDGQSQTVMPYPDANTLYNIYDGHVGKSSVRTSIKSINYSSSQSQRTRDSRLLVIYVSQSVVCWSVPLS